MVGLIKGNPKVSIYDWLWAHSFLDKPIQYDDKRYTVLGNELIVTKKTKGVHYFKCIIELKTIGAKYAVSKKLEGNLGKCLIKSHKLKKNTVQ